MSDRVFQHAAPATVGLVHLASLKDSSTDSRTMIAWNSYTSNCVHGHGKFGFFCRVAWVRELRGRGKGNLWQGGHLPCRLQVNWIHWHCREAWGSSLRCLAWGGSVAWTGTLTMLCEPCPLNPGRRLHRQHGPPERPRALHDRNRRWQQADIIRDAQLGTVPHAWTCLCLTCSFRLV